MVREKQIRVWMLKRSIRVQDVADGAGVDKSYVSHFLAGRKKSPKVRQWLLMRGCPAKLLGSNTEKAA